MHDLIAAAAELQQFLKERDLRFAFIGGLANLAWGDPRTTRDVDVSIFATFGSEGPLVEALLKRYESRIEHAATFAADNRVLLLRGMGGIPIDVALAAFEYESEAISRSRTVDFGRAVCLEVITAEDLIVMKAFAGREQDWVDVAGVATRQFGNLDWPAIHKNAGILAPAASDPTMQARLRKLEQLQP